MLNANQKFKSTPVGDIPVDWECVRLGNRIILASGKAKPEQSVKNKEADSEVPIYGGNGVIGYSDLSLINQETILIGRVGEHCGSIHFHEGKCWVSDNCLFLKSVILNDDVKYLSYLLRYLKLGNLKNKKGQPLISQKAILNLYSSLPPLPEQQKIAEILGTWDQAIDTQKQLINTLTKRKKALAQQLLTGKTRLPGFESEWKEAKLSDLFSRVSDKNTDGHTQVLTISAQKGLICQQDFFNKQIASKELNNYFILKKGQFAYNKSYSKGYPMGVIKRLNKYDQGVVTTLYICFKIKNHTHLFSDFWEHYFESGALNRGLTRIAHEAGRAHGLLNVTPKDFFELQLKTPSTQEQTAIAKVLTTADQEIHLHTQNLTHLTQQKKALMQQLLTGKTRVTI